MINGSNFTNIVVWSHNLIVFSQKEPSRVVRFFLSVMGLFEVL